jgi:hypothetical protein
MSEVETAIETVRATLIVAESTGRIREKVRILSFIKQELELLETPLKQWSEPALHRQQALRDVYEFIKSDTEEGKSNE